MALTIHDIADRFEINDLLVRYCYAVDDRDWDSYQKVFTPDAVIDDTIIGGVRSGVEDHIVFMKKALAKIKISQHAISTVLLTVHGNEANTRVHCSCPMVVDVGDGKTQFFSRFITMCRTGLHSDQPPNHALQRTAAGCRDCNRRASWPPSLSLGR